ncbi:MAG: ATP-citrate lyase subunit A [Parcubacteria group bacterium GW2011_GWA2_44_12]|nr:MAG: ATP-citrate lyase subunit A [Parcubacteria group bacterium GW2011_GWA2_44_12]
MQSYLLFNKNTQAIIHGYQIDALARMLDFDYVSGRAVPSVAAIINASGGGFHKAFFGQEEILIPIYTTLAHAAKKHQSADVMINFASLRSAFDTTLSALEQETIRTVVIIAEGVPERRARMLIAHAKKRGKWIIGPATVGGITAGQFKIGNTGGPIENIIAAKLHRPGSVGFVSKSGGMSNELFNVIAQHTNGIYEGIAIGGDAYPGSTFYEHLLRYEHNPEIKMLVLLGEVGGEDEYQVAEALKNKTIKKPLAAWVTGTCAKEFPSEVQFGHAGAKSGVQNESADAKNKALAKAGAIVPQSFNDFGEKIHQVYGDLVKRGIVKEQEEAPVPSFPQNFESALKEKKIRKTKEMMCSISCDTGQEATYLGVPITRILEDTSSGLGYVIGLLWFKKRLPPFACAYIELILKAIADHGPCVSGAHNTIVAARAGKDLISSLASGLLTIGPRFGGAIDSAAIMFKNAFDRKLSPSVFVQEMKDRGELIPGIGHKIKSTKNPDSRVVFLKTFTLDNFAVHSLLDYALEVEKITTAKKENLILNVDGCIGVSFVDMLKSMDTLFTPDEVDGAISLGCLNALFVLGRSIGMMGHYFDQKRYGEGLYRYPQNDVLYLTKGETNA